jgi:lauroyl/myristoyl acyltransferase
VRLLLSFFAILPWRVIDWLARGTAWLQATIFPFRRQVVVNNLKLALP